MGGRVSTNNNYNINTEISVPVVFSPCSECTNGYFIFSKCNHSFCKQCLCKYLQNFSSALIECPDEGCLQLVPDNIVRQCLSDPQLELYDRLCQPSTAVRCKVPECTGAVVVEGQRGVYTCPICDQPYCIACKSLHLENERCNIAANNAKYEKAGQKVLVEKNGLKLLQLTKNNNLTKNPETSKCMNCNDFLLPREGIIVSTCFHTFCRDCLDGHVRSQGVLAGLTCLKCDKPLDHMECKEIIGEDKLFELSLKAVKFKFYNCQTPDCSSFWERGTYTGLYKCQKCKIDNCMACRDIHVGLTCAQYKDSETYKSRLKDEELKRQQNLIICFSCQYSFVKRKGCGAMRCTNCLKQVCAFSGKELGQTGCNCRKSKRCHVNCDQGCIPEGKSDYENSLKRYYYDN